MVIDKAVFVYVLSTNPPSDILRALDRGACGCNYIYHWYVNMHMGQWNPALNEMDHELRDIKTAGDLFDFLQNRNP